MAAEKVAWPAATAPTPTSKSATSANAKNAGVGSETPRLAVQHFLDAAQNEDLQGLSAYWGDEAGPTRDRFPRQELERRELIMIGMLKRHDKRRTSASR